MHALHTKLSNTLGKLDAHEIEGAGNTCDYIIIHYGEEWTVFHTPQKEQVRSAYQKVMVGAIFTIRLINRWGFKNSKGE